MNHRVRTVGLVLGGAVAALGLLLPERGAAVDGTPAPIIDFPTEPAG